MQSLFLTEFLYFFNLQFESKFLWKLGLLSHIDQFITQIYSANIPLSKHSAKMFKSIIVNGYSVKLFLSTDWRIQI